MPRVAEVAGIMTGSYIGGGVNFVALKNHYAVPAERANPLIVADNFIMAGMFGLLFLIAGSKFFSPPFSPPALARTRPRAEQIPRRRLGLRHRHPHRYRRRRDPSALAPALTALLKSATR